MIGRILIYLGAVLPLIWGVSHLFPTQKEERIRQGAGGEFFSKGNGSAIGGQ